MKKRIEGTKVVFSFDGLESVVFDSTKASLACLQRAGMHGWSARIGDMAAIEKRQKDGSVIKITEAMRRDAILAGVSHYESGTDDWSMKGERTSPQNPVILAIAEKRGCTYAEAEAFLAAQFLGEMA